MNEKMVPQTDSIRELARFWDTHDLTDFEEHLEVVSEPVFERDTMITIHLQSGDAEAVKNIAKRKGVGYVELIRQWVLEKIHVS